MTFVGAINCHPVLSCRIESVPLDVEQGPKGRVSSSRKELQKKKKNLWRMVPHHAVACCSYMYSSLSSLDWFRFTYCIYIFGLLTNYIRYSALWYHWLLNPSDRAAMECRRSKDHLLLYCGTPVSSIGTYGKENLFFRLIHTCFFSSFQESSCVLVMHMIFEARNSFFLARHIVNVVCARFDYDQINCKRPLILKDRVE